MSNLIEQYLQQLLQQSSEKFIEIQRNELAERFDCVPSQINYVLSTRFSIEKGYVVESRRGGGGFVRIVKVPLNEGELDLVHEIVDLVEDGISERSASAIVSRLLEEKIITLREAAMINACLSKTVLRLGLPIRDQLRADIMKAILMVIFKNYE